MGRAVKDLFERATVQAVIAFLLVATFCALSVMKADVSDMLFGATMAILTYYFVKKEE